MREVEDTKGKGSRTSREERYSRAHVDKWDGSMGDGGDVNLGLWGGSVIEMELAVNWMARPVLRQVSTAVMNLVELGLSFLPTNCQHQEQRSSKTHPTLETSESATLGLSGPVWRQWRHGCHMAIPYFLLAEVHGLRK